MKRALPPLPLLVNCVSAPPVVVMVALPAALVSENEMRLPEPLLMMVELPAELEPRKDILPLLVIAAFAAVQLLKKIRPAFVKLGANAELLLIPAPLMLKVKKRLKGLMVNEYSVTAAVNWIVLIDVELEIVTDVGVPGLFVNVAMLSGTVLGVGVEFQLLPWVHSLETGAPPPIQVPLTCAVAGTDMASAPSQTLPSSAARLKAGCAAAGAIRKRCRESRRAVPADATRMNAYPTPTGGSRRASPSSPAPSRADE